ncbi:hypothetical protein PHMEG_0008087 [Phytophthora megakarya]|uniref:Uncharacterized protein n=1 Tax=Phytophthora megakarya TaxID=4795 RepID=A0A225WKX8_9STRA|nr:hypothetical protein PHMEG_0008087 [Phytophthora megakarya]
MCPPTKETMAIPWIILLYIVTGVLILTAYKGALIYWISFYLAEDGHENLKRGKFAAYLGLELAMSITQRNEIAYYGTIRSHLRILSPLGPNPQAKSNDPLWHSRDLLNHLQKIRSHLRILSPLGPNPQVKSNDPLWHSRDLFNHLQKNSKNWQYRLMYRR